MKPEREPIVHAVLADPVVKAVLADPSSASAVVAALNEGGDVVEGVVPNPPTPPPTEHPTNPTTTVESGTTTKKTIAGTTTTSEGRLVATPTSTEEEERVSLGQRTVNLIWENTQMKVALSVIWMALAVSGVLSVFGQNLGSPDIQLAAVVFLFGVANLVTGFYFGRTNHQKIGGVEQGR